MCSYISSETIKTCGCFSKTLAISLNSFSVYTDPLGLHGELNINIFVFSVIAFSICLALTLKLSLTDEEISIGDFVLTGGEIPAITVINGVIRLLPGTLGSAESLEEESHNEFLLEHPQYTHSTLRF